MAKAKDMTVAIAAKAEDGHAIVAVLDKQRTNEASGLRIQDVDVKGFSLNEDWVFFYSGDGTFAGAVEKEARRLIGAGSVALGDADGIRSLMRQAYTNVYDPQRDDIVFRGHSYDHQKYVDRTYPSDVLREIEKLEEDFRSENTADLLVCGFGADGLAHIVVVMPDHPGEIAGSFAAIGVGQDVAEQHLSYRNTLMNRRLQHVIYETLEAKMHSENAYIGDQTDAFILFRTGRVHLSGPTKDDLAAAVKRHERAPVDALSAPEEQREDWVRILMTEKIGAVLKQIRFAADHPTLAGSLPRIGVDVSQRFVSRTPSSATSDEIGSIGSVPPSSQWPDGEKR